MESAAAIGIGAGGTSAGVSEAIYHPHPEGVDGLFPTPSTACIHAGVDDLFPTPSTACIHAGVDPGSAEGARKERRRRDVQRKSDSYFGRQNGTEKAYNGGLC